ncbi:hypothetical protein Acor_30860 [Acrocarpospora corrugata]|uniref:Uncharacterized protein n=1 Tax=Acrocarpospora corrugata TaxID=35763 RepID=A0A5M3VZ57_9ACTN|nr:hypothetical protein [Acrocarpospora corrugata]GES01022.1 hypothetical protein Acor_30860 [Acrocarpospora corrugata]
MATTGNSLASDKALLRIYSAALTRVLHDREIRDAFDHVWVRPLQIRLEMERDAAEVMAEAPQEYNAYLRARHRHRGRSATVVLPDPGSPGHSRTVADISAKTNIPRSSLTFVLVATKP